MADKTRLPDPGDPGTLYLVDISSYVFRAYHALPPLTSPAGEPTHAVLGVTTMLLKLIQDRRPAMLVVAMDSRTKSFRHELYDQYKANRPPAPPDLKQQMTRVGEVVEAYHLPIMQQDGMEADDVIASAVKRARDEGLNVVIVSSDKDLMQLLGDDVTMYDTAREKVYGPPEAEKKLGVPPPQVRDYLALVGDSSDNVPGVPSVGPKTATQLLAEYGDLDGIYEHLGDIKRKAVKKKLEDFRDQAYLSRDLVTLEDDVDVAVDADELAFPEPDVGRLRSLFTELGFTRLLAQLPGDGEAGAGEAPAPRARVEAECVADEKTARQLAKQLEKAGRFALLSVMDGVHPVSGHLVGLAFALPDATFYVPVGHDYLGSPTQLDPEVALKILGPLLENGKIEKLCADSKRETMVLGAAGVKLAGVVFDAMLASYLVDPERHAHRLEDIARFELDEALDDADKALLQRRVEAGKIAATPIETATVHGGKLAQFVFESCELLAPKLEAEQSSGLLRSMELPLARVLAAVEMTGIRVDVGQLRELGGAVSKQVQELEARCKELAGHDFNVNSPRQLETILFDELELPVIKRTKTARSTDQSVLEELAIHHDLPAAILEHRMLAKLKSTYLDALPREINPKTGRIHTDFRQAVAATGRLSSSDPNLQNIPIRTEVGRRIRDAFVPRDGCRILSMDYSQIELRVLAHLSHDAELMDAYEKGADVHVRTARAIFGVGEADVTREMRAQAKTVNFAVIYGQTQFALARNLRIERAEASRYIKAFFAQYEGVAQYMERVVEEAKELGYTRTLCGRIRRLPDLRSDNRVKRQAAERVARNTPIQGTAADIIKLAMIAIQDDIESGGMDSRMLLTVHDELVFEAPKKEEKALEKLVREHMENALSLDVPLVVEGGWGASWGEAH
ncbi:MAG: DNA polymerase I [Myxococcales bacterium]|jgi:DNA polymerase-1